MGGVCGRAEQCGAAEAASCEKCDLAIQASFLPQDISRIKISTEFHFVINLKFLYVEFASRIWGVAAFSLKGEGALLALLRRAPKKRRQAKSLASLCSFCKSAQFISLLSKI